MPQGWTKFRRGHCFIGVMILEGAMLDVKPGQDEAFERDFAKASAYISAIDGYLSHELQRCLLHG